MLEAFLVSTGAVLLGEFGDKTQLLALLLATRFRKPWPVIAGIFVATVLNHALAGVAGVWLHGMLPDPALPWIVGASFIAVGLWALKPDTLEAYEGQALGRSVFLIATLAFFLAEIGDKTQIATMVLAVRYDALFAVVSGTTLGMLLANLPVVFVGAALAQRLPLKAIRIASATLFIALGLATLLYGA